MGLDFQDVPELSLENGGNSLDADMGYDILLSTVSSDELLSPVEAL
jgi:hypothetical protein